jgi:hypothetical protein
LLCSHERKPFMSQDVSTNQRANESLAPSLPVQPWSAEAEADKLMDDLFSDLDRMLEGGSKLPTETVKPDYVSLQSLAIPNIPKPPTVASPEEQGQDSQEEVTEVAPSLEADEPHSRQAAPQRSGWSFEKLLLIAGLASLAITAILLLTRWDRLNWPGLGNPTTSPTADRGQFAADAEFVNYMLRSLDAIERQAVADEPIASAGEIGNALSMPSIPLPENPSAPPNRAPTVLERVYIPVYPPQSPAAPTAPTAPAPAPTPASPAAPAPSRQAAASSPANSVPTLPATPASPSQTPTATHTLVGLLELGDRSAALFNIDGSTQRIRVGEAIGNSGWTLVSVANQEAVIRRNGEVRSVYVGQKF